MKFVVVATVYSMTPRTSCSRLAGDLSNTLQTVLSRADSASLLKMMITAIITISLTQINNVIYNSNSCIDNRRHYKGTAPPLITAPAPAMTKI